VKIYKQDNHQVWYNGDIMAEIFSNSENDEVIKEIKGVSIEKIVDSIKRALIASQTEMESSGIKIKLIQLTLKSIATEKAGAGITLQIPILGELKIGSNISTKSVQTTFLALKPTKNPTKEIYKPKGLDEKLKEIILNLTEGVKAAVNNQPPLEMDEASAELNFVLKSESEISMIIKTGFDAELTNNLKVIFERI
jgi:hypothetical protein